MEAEEIALCMLVKNEEGLLAPLLDTLSSYVGEIIIVDTGSEDGTVVEAAQYADIVCYYPLTSDFSAARNYAQSLSRSPWILVFAADEQPTQALLNWLSEYTPKDGVKGVCFRAENYLGGKLRKDKLAYEWHVRLYRREYKWGGTLHEHVHIPNAGQDSPVLHCPPEESVLYLHHKSMERQRRQNALYKTMKEDTAIRLNIGCGAQKIRGWVNIDRADVPPGVVDKVCDVTKGLPHAALSIDSIWARHIDYDNVSYILGDWCRVLKIGGDITIKTSDFDDDWLQAQLEKGGCGSIKWLPDVNSSVTVQATKVRHVRCQEG